LLGDELDGPRGRIYLIKQMLEGQPVTEKTQLHLDRCLSCRACETTCPSGVKLSPPARDRARGARGAGAAFAGQPGDAFPALRSAAARWIFKPAVPSAN
jgi:Fe-S oxidoreductase